MARPIFLPCSIARNVGTSPTLPKIAVTKISASCVATSIKPLSPEVTKTSLNSSFNFLTSFSCLTETSLGLNSAIIFLNTSMFSPTEIASSVNLSLFKRMTSSVCVPIEPVAPNIDTLFIFTPLNNNRQYVH